MIRLWLLRVLLVAFVVVAAVIVVALQVSDYLTDQAKQGHPTAQRTALDWYPRNAVARRIDGRRQLPSDMTSLSLDKAQPAVSSFKQAVADSPLETRAMARLVSTLALAGVTGPEIDQLAALADRLAPVKSQVQGQLLVAALAREENAQAVSHLARTLVGDPGSRNALFPVLQALWSSDAGRNAITQIAQDPRPYRWWGSFLNYLSAQARTESKQANAIEGVALAILRELITARSASGAWPLQPSERAIYIATLRREGLIEEAYLHWVNGLSKEALLRLGYVFDGGFNLPFDNSPGFGWQAKIAPQTGIIVSRSETFGSSDDASLRVSFSGKRVRFKHVSQELALPPGGFRVRGRVRPDQLEGRIGVGLVFRCTLGTSMPAVQSEPWLGTGEWREFWFDVSVPPECRGQQLRLESLGKREVDHELRGTLWLDDLQIERFE